MARKFLIWFWSGGGGGSQFAFHLARRLRARFGADAVALSMRADDPVLAQARADGLDARAAETVSARRRPLTTLAALAQSGRILAEHARDADAVIAPMNFAAAAPLSLTLAKPLIYCAHDPEPHPGDYAAAMQRMTQAVLLRRAAHVVALSHYAAGRLAAQGIKSRVAPLQSVFEPAPAPRPAPGGPVQLLMAGRMIEYKGLDILAGALPSLDGRDDWRLRVVGDGPALDEPMLSRLKHPNVVEARRAWLSDAEVHELVASCDILLAPYRSATQSGVVAQAIALGKPCVATPVGALAEQIGEAGWIAHGADSASFLRALAAALDASAQERARRGVAAQTRARVDWESDAWDWVGAVEAPPAK